MENKDLVPGRYEIPFRPLGDRLQDYASVYDEYDNATLASEAEGCMTCGVPFCNWSCPLGNLMPEINPFVQQGKLWQAYQLLKAHNPFPEITCRVCPALCESACARGIHRQPVPVRDIERLLVDQAWHQGWEDACPPQQRSGKNVAVVGSGPAGLAVAWQLNLRGHAITVYEKCQKIGGLLRYGIPDFKLEKRIVDARIAILEAEGVVFRTNHNLGERELVQLQLDYDAVVYAGGCETPNDLAVAGRRGTNVVFAMDYLSQQNKFAAGEVASLGQLDALGKKVVVIGAGDTGQDCAGTAARQGAALLSLVDILPKPASGRSTHPAEDLGERCNYRWQHRVAGFPGAGEMASHVELSKVRWVDCKSGTSSPVDVPDSMVLLPADLIIIAMGFAKAPLPASVAASGVFVAGDARTGQSLVVSAIADGLDTARQVELYLTSRKQ
jgi:glutamate synthase (NADPH/NADH) small chain